MEKIIGMCPCFSSHRRRPVCGILSEIGEGGSEQRQFWGTHMAAVTENESLVGHYPCNRRNNGNALLDRKIRPIAVSYTHLTLPTTPYV